MLSLRKILLCKYLYIILLGLTIIYTVIYINVDYKSKYSGKEKEIVGIVTDIFIGENKLDLKIYGLEIIMVTYYLEEDIPLYKLGDKIKVEGKLNKPVVQKTSNLFDYSKHLKRKKIYYQMEATNITFINNSNNIYYKLKNKVKDMCKNNPYLYTFILGDKRYLNDEVKISYQENGISHLFAISGMHISLLAGILLYLLSKVKVKENKKYFIVIIVLTIYLLIVGFLASILRSVLFFILFAINKLFDFNINIICIFILVLSSSLLINPFYIYDVGFLYSFSISLVLLIFGEYINSYRGYIKKLLIVSLLAFITSFPITIYFFYQINLLSIIYNIFYVPFVSILIFPLSLIMFMGVPLDFIFTPLIIFLEESSLFINKIDVFKIVFMKLDNFYYLIYIIFTILFLIGIYYKKIKYTVMVIVLIIFHKLYFYYNTYIVMLDVGQGDSFLFFDKGKTIIIDTGGKYNYYTNTSGDLTNYVIKPYLRSMGIKKIDLLILSHGDYDHLGETFNLSKYFEINEILINNNELNYNEEKIKNSFNNVSKLENDITFKVNNFTFNSLGFDLGDENDSSIILLITYKDISFLMMGDASIKSEIKLLDKYNIKNIDYLKVGHHGSKTSTSKKLLEETTPKYALISAGVNNIFNHPNQEVIDRLKDYNIKIFSTQEIGSKMINLNN